MTSSRIGARLVAIVLVVSLMTGLTGCSRSQPGSREGQSGFVAGSGAVTILAPADRPPAPPLAGTTLTGARWSLAAQRGKPVVINVWGSWCAPCRKEAPELDAAARRLAGKAVFMGLNTRDLDPAPARRFVVRFKVSYPSLYDPDGSLLLGFRGQTSASAIPSTLVIDAQGRVAGRVLGAVDTTTLVGMVNDVSS